MSRLFVVILKCFKLLDMSYLPIQNVKRFSNTLNIKHIQEILKILVTM